MNWLLSAGNYIENLCYRITDRLSDDSFWFKNYYVDIHQYYIGSATPDTSNIKLVQISDLHLRTIGPGLKKALQKINALKPDLILLTGDSITAQAYLPLLDTLLKLLDHDIQKAAIVGNWEYTRDLKLDDLRKVYAQNNCVLLINETRQFTLKNKTISITGLDDFTMGNADFKEAVSDYKNSDYHIVLTHCPQHRDIIRNQMTDDIPIDFILSGHTHGGQISLFGFVPFSPYGSGTYVKGWYKESEPILYVSQGVGTSILPLRLGSRAEIGIFNLKA
jgi:predicted MPP superfamily phosphohydrolase